MSDQSSNFSFYSIGIVVKDIVPGQDTITVSPIEHLNVQKDQPLDSSSVTNQGTLDSPINSNSFNTEIKSSGNITAKWINLGGSNRITAPDVYKGETVILYKYENVDEYYWSTVFREPTLRKQETVVTAYSNEKAPMKEFNPDSSYWTMFDTRGKKVQLHTSKNDSEPVTYDATIDTKKGTLELFRDSNGNYMLLNSVDKSLLVYLLEKIQIKDQAGDSITITKGSNSIEITSGKSVTIKTKNTTVISENTTINCPNNTINGNLSISGSLKVSGGMSTSGSVTASGNITTSGNISASGTVSGSNI